MVMSPLELHNKEFTKSLRGYNTDEVDGFLGLLLKDYEEIYKQNLDLKELLDKKDDNIHQYKEMEETLRNTMVVAQQTAQNVREAAQNEAEAKVAQAHKEAANLIREAEMKAEDLVQQARQQGEEIVRQFDDLQKQSYAFKTKFRTLLNAQLQIIDDVLEKDA